MDRRAFLRRAMAAGAVASTNGLWLPRSMAHARALRLTFGGAADPAGTTLESAIALAVGEGYRRLVDGPGWPTIERAELAEPQRGREDRRRPLAVIVHLTDIHLIDAQSPGRVEFLDVHGDPFTAAFRPQEMLTVQVQASMVQRINDLAAGPVTGRPFDCAVSTGDNIDNQQRNETDWFVGVLDGGTITPDSGDSERYEGMQDGVEPSDEYWHPDEGLVDKWKRDLGYPDIPGFLDAARRSSPKVSRSRGTRPTATTTVSCRA
jgi:hypothetical protein